MGHSRVRTRARRGACKEAGDAARGHAKFRLRMDAAARGVELAGPEKPANSHPKTWETAVVATPQKRPALPKVRPTNPGGILPFSRAFGSPNLRRCLGIPLPEFRSKSNPDSGSRAIVADNPVNERISHESSSGNVPGISIQVAVGAEQSMCSLWSKLSAS